MRALFRSLRGYNYRVWSAGGLVSNIGTWMQRTAQDWLVLTELTHHNAAAVGLVSALQFGPQLLLLPLTGLAADRLDRRRLVLATQIVMGALALGLGVLTLTGAVRLWQVYGFAFLLGCAAAFDAPARQTFVAALVGEADLSNAVALNSTSFNAARTIGPAIAGLMIASVGTGWVFVINAASYVAVIVSLRLLRMGEMHADARAPARRGNLMEGFRYVRGRPDLITVLVMIFLIGTFGFNFPVFISTMAVTAFHAGAQRYGVLTSIMAIGSVAGALLSAQRRQSGLGVVVAGAAVFGGVMALAAVTPSYWLFAALLAITGMAAQTITTNGNSTVQLSTEPAMRGRVMAILLAIAVGGTPIGAPVVGWVINRFGPRWGLGVGAAAGIVAALVGLRYLARHRGLRVRVADGRLRIGFIDVA